MGALSFHQTKLYVFSMARVEPELPPLVCLSKADSCSIDSILRRTEPPLIITCSETDEIAQYIEDPFVMLIIIYDNSGPFLKRNYREIERVLKNPRWFLKESQTLPFETIKRKKNRKKDRKKELKESHRKLLRCTRMSKKDCSLKSSRTNFSIERRGG